MEDSSFFFKGSTLHCIKTVHHHPVIFMGKMNIFDIVFPKICVGCGREGKYICDTCQRKLLVPEQICPMCCKPSLDGWTHPKCIRAEGMERLITGLSYPGLVQKCLKKVKYKSAWEIIAFLYGLGNFHTVENGVITSVPMWRQKERSRGFNQAEILAQLIADDCDIANIATLERTRETKPMFGLKKKARLENVEGAFRITKQHTNKLIYERVIIVDDVWTTGATMRECARMLKQAGAREIWGLTLAK